MSSPKHVTDAIARLLNDHIQEKLPRQLQPATLKGLGEVNRYLSGYARLLVGNGGLSGHKDITITTYDEGKFPSRGFWNPSKRIFGIQNPDPSMDPRQAKDQLKAVTVHEVGHVRHTDPDIIRNTLELQQEKSLMMLLNIFEDCRVERLITKEYPGTQKSITALRIFCVGELEEDLEKRKANPFSVTHGIVSEIAVFSELRNEEVYLENVRSDFSEPGKAENFIRDVSEAARETLFAKSTAECLEAVRIIRNKYFPRIKDESPQSGAGKEILSSSASSGNPDDGNSDETFDADSAKEDMEKVEKIIHGTSLEDFAQASPEEETSKGEDLKSNELAETEDPSSQFNRQHEPLGDDDWHYLLGRCNRNLHVSAWNLSQKFMKASLSGQTPRLGSSGRLDMRKVFENNASGRFSLDVFRSEEIVTDPTFYLLAILDCSGSMHGNPIDEGCKIAYMLAKKQSYDPAFRVRILMCNSSCRYPLLLKDYDIPLTESGIYALRTFDTNSAGEGLITSDPYFKHPRKPDMALFLTDGQVDSVDVEWLKSIRWYVPIRAAYVGGKITNVEEGFKQTFGNNAYILKQTAEELGSHLDRLLNTFTGR